MASRQPSDTADRRSGTAHSEEVRALAEFKKKEPKNPYGVEQLEKARQIRPGLSS
jgi:hypothetical protein